MAVSFSSNDEVVIHRKISDDISNQFYSTFSLEEFFEISVCCNWICTEKISKVALQFPDALLQYSAEVSVAIQSKANCEIYVLGDTSYQSCCVDEIAAEHVSADGIIHFGPACLSPTTRLPVLYIFGKKSLQIDNVVNEFSNLFEDRDDCILVLSEVFFAYALGEIKLKLEPLYKNTIFAYHYISNKNGKLSIGSSCEKNEVEEESAVKIEKCGQCFELPSSQSLTDYKIFFIGLETQTLINLMLAFNHCQFFIYDPVSKHAKQNTLNVSKYLRKRYYLIERAKDAKIVGILVGTLGVKNYLHMINHLRTIIKAAGKKAYVISVGKLNSAKLANFPEIEIFVFVACTECSIVDAHEFYQPIVTPFEMEIACNNARSWTGDYVTDFSDLLPGSSNYVPLQIASENIPDVSLITGKLRSLGESEVDETNSGASSIVKRDEMLIANIHSDAAGEHLVNRSWRGLEQKLGQTPVAVITQGQKGLASVYEGEGQAQEL